MDGFEKLLPIVLMIAVSILFSAQKKKAQSKSATPPTAPQPKEESPWDELMREIKKLQTPEEELRQPTQIPSSPAMSQPTPTATPLEASQPIEEEAEPFSYDEETMEELERQPIRSYEEPEALPLASSSATLAAVTDTPQATPSSHPATSPEEESTAPRFPWGDTFDPRMAVLYSEILKPRF
ncbi:MAG: hypothetical protein PHV49_04945 [Alistipes sp.]|nr:hypothetical protein [Alistipes sp.]